jgi:tetratricopeptide (TPR) repeat protein
MANDFQKPCASKADELAGACALTDLVHRTQLDFEIEFFERILSRDPKNVEMLKLLGDLFSRKRFYRRALMVDLRLTALRPTDAVAFYNLACSRAMLNHVDAALDSLERAVELGFDDVDQLLADDELAALYCQPRFHKLLKGLEARK